MNGSKYSTPLTFSSDKGVVHSAVSKKLIGIIFFKYYINIKYDYFNSLINYYYNIMKNRVSDWILFNF